MPDYIPMTEDRLEPMGFVLPDGTILRVSPVEINGFEQIRIPMSDGSCYRVTLETEGLKRKDWFYAAVLYPHDSGLRIDERRVPDTGKFMYTTKEHLQNGLELLLGQNFSRGVVPVDIETE